MLCPEDMKLFYDLMPQTSLTLIGTLVAMSTISQENAQTTDEGNMQEDLFCPNSKPPSGLSHTDRETL